MLSRFWLRRLQQIVEGMLLERLHRVFVVGGQKHDVRHAVGIQHADHFQPADARHLDIEKHHVRLQSVDLADGFDGVGAFADNRDLRLGLQQMAQVVARGRFIVNNQCV